MKCLPYALINNCLVQKEIDDLREESKQRWVALLDSDPIHHVSGIEWGPGTDQRIGGATGPLLVNIGGIEGTVCVDNFDEHAATFFCSNLMTGGGEISSISHKSLEAYGEYPILLTNVQCQANATTVNDCTSGPMGYSNCASGNDTVLTCALY